MTPATLTITRVFDSPRVRQPIDHGADRVETAHQDCDRLRVHLLGGLRVRVGETSIGPREFGGAKPRRVLLALLLHRGTPVSKDRLISLLWGESPPISAKATIEAYVCLLRKKLQPSQGGRASLITTVSGGYAIDMGRVDLDVTAYERLMSAGLAPATSATDALPMLRQAIALAQSPLLPEEDGSEWLDEMRRTHGSNVRKDLIAAANKVAGLPSGEAERWARLALEDDPLDESAWHALLASMEASGQHADGLQAYDQCRRLFAAELGCAPGPGMRELHVRLLRGADEDKDQLSHLLDAVVRLHMVSQLGAGPPMAALGNGIGEAITRRGWVAQSGSVEQAWGALSQLLLTVGERRNHLAGAWVA